MNTTTSFFGQVQAMIRRISEAVSYPTPARVPMEPLMETLPTRGTRPRGTQTRRLTSFMQMSIDG